MTLPKTLRDRFFSAAAALLEAAAGFLDLLPALALAMLFLRAAELTAGIQTGAMFTEIAGTAAASLALDLLSLVRYLPVLFLCSLSFLPALSRRRSFRGLGLAWSLLVLAQAALAQFFLTARDPLGADLFAYSWGDICETVAGGAGLNVILLAGLVLALISLWTALILLNRRSQPAFSPRVAAVVFAIALLVMLAAPKRFGGTGSGTEDTYKLTLNKAAFFLDSNLAYLKSSRIKEGPGLPAQTDSAAPGAVLHYLDPKYPFLRDEQTPDVLGPYFRILKGSPPNLVFIIVEGLGRSFSGPGAHLGSFTPRLDELAGSSLYWENFLAVQGRTFAALPSIFASLPFGAKGLSALGERMPAHDSLLSVLKGQGYRLKFYGGFPLDFDNERLFFRREGMDVMVDENDFGTEYARGNPWGYADSEVVSRMLAGEIRDPKQPFVSVLQTMTTHTPYTFPGQARYYARFERRLDELGVGEGRKEVYRAYRDIYTSILYTDEALGRFFEETKKNPAYQNTVFILTGDHRLPEIPMATKIDRYYVPLLVFSPLLKAPARIKAVSSHFDIAPSLLAFLSHNYGVPTPHAVTWIGTGLDMEPSFRSTHNFPLKQTKTNLVDFVSGTWFIDQDTLFELSDGMNIEQVRNEAALALVRAQFAAFRAANDRLERTLALIPEGAPGQLSPYHGEERARPVLQAAGSAAVISVSEVRAPADAQAGKLTIEAVFDNTGPAAAGEFVPLVVLLTADGRELSESYAARQRLAAGKTVSVRIPVKSAGVAPGSYFLSVLPSHPETGKKVGAGRYRIPVRLHD